MSAGPPVYPAFSASRAVWARWQRDWAAWEARQRAARRQAYIDRLPEPFDRHEGDPAR